MVLSAKNNSKTRYNGVELSQSEQSDRVNLLLLIMIFLINATVGLSVVYPKFYVIGNEKCTCNREAFKTQLKGKHHLFISSCKWIPKLFLINAAVGLIVAYPNFYVIGNEKCTCNRESFKERLKGKYHLFISSCKLIVNYVLEPFSIELFHFL